MNETSLPASSILPDTSSPEFSRANLFGMFVTLQLCQLTQPYGSLLFRGSSGFFWRVNPIGSFVEALIIAYCLLKTIWQAWRKEKLGRIQWGKKLRATASAMLLLRGALEDEDGGLMAKLMAASFLDGAQHAETRPTNQGTTPSGADAGQEEAETLSNPGRMPDVREYYEIGPITTESDSRSPQTATPPQGVLRRRTSQLESALVRRTNTITGPDPSSERSHLLRTAFGPNALAHREMRIDIVTAVSVLVIFVKLLAIRSLWLFLTAAHFIIFGWLLVQSLLLLFHSRELSDFDMAASLRAARLLDAGLEKDYWKWKWLYVALHAPLLGYVCYTLAFQFELPSWLPWVRYLIEFFLLLLSHFVLGGGMVGLIIGISYSVAVLIAGIFSLIISLCRPSIAYWRLVPQHDFSEDLRKSLRVISLGILGSLGSLVLLWVLLGTLSYYIKITTEWDGELSKPYTPIFGNSRMSTIVESGFTTTISGIWMIFLFAMMTTIFTSVLLPTGAESRSRVSWGNFLLTVIVFIYYLITYDPQGSSKPNWTEWLG